MTLKATRVSSVVLDVGCTLSNRKIYFVQLDWREREGGGLVLRAHMLVDCMTSGLSVIITRMQEAKWTEEESIELSAIYKRMNCWWEKKRSNSTIVRHLKYEMINLSIEESYEKKTYAPNHNLWSEGNYQMIKLIFRKSYNSLLKYTFQRFDDALYFSFKKQMCYLV